MKLLFALLLLPSAALGAYCNGIPDPDAPENNLPIVGALPNVVKSVNNGILARSDDSMNKFQITHLWGSPYEQGLAHGQLLSDDISNFFESTYKYLADQVVGSLPNKVRQIEERSDELPTLVLGTKSTRAPTFI